MRITIWALFFAVALLSQSSFSASFDCKKASTKVEKIICSDIELGSRDESLSKHYERALAVSPGREMVKKEQREWLKGMAKCPDAICIKRQYETRINALAEIFFNRITLACLNEVQSTMLVCSSPNLRKKYSEYIELYKTERGIDKNGVSRLDNFFHKTLNEIQAECKNAECADEKLNFLIDFSKRKIRNYQEFYMPKWKPKLIASGVEHTCVAGEDIVKCWGTPGNENLFSSKKFINIKKLEDSTSCVKDSKGWQCRENRNLTDEIPDEMNDAEKLVATEYHICGLKNKKVKCWGNDRYGAIDIPSHVSDVIDVATSLTHTCAVLNGGDVECWGKDSYGEISSARQFKNAVKIYVGFKFTCIENKEGNHQCTNIVNDLDGNQQLSSEQKSFLDNNKFIYFTASNQRICGITKDKSFACFPEWKRKIPNSIINDHSLYAISFGNGHICVLSEKNGISCWGTYANENVNLYKMPYDAKEIMLDAFIDEQS